MSKPNPRSVEALRLDGDIHMYLKSDPDQALVDYRKALELDPNAAPVHLAIMSILMAQHKPDEAEKQLAQPLGVLEGALGRGANLDNGYAAGQLRKTLLKLFLVVVRVGGLDLLAD